MKKFLSFFLILSVLFCMIPTAQGAGTAKLTGPDTVVPGQTVTVAFYAWGDVLGGSGKVRYDPAQLTLERYQTASQEWQVDFMGDQFLFYADFLPPEHTPVFKATFRLSDSLAPGTQVSVTVCDLVVSDGNADSRLESNSQTFKIHASANRPRVHSAGKHPERHRTHRAGNHRKPYGSTDTNTKRERL